MNCIVCNNKLKHIVTSTDPKNIYSVFRCTNHDRVIYHEYDQMNRLRKINTTYNLYDKLYSVVYNQFDRQLAIYSMDEFAVTSKICEVNVSVFSVSVIGKILKLKVFI